jgi:hypothetical protein
MMMDQLSYDERWKALIDDVNEHFGVNIKDKYRGTNYVEARNMYCHICYKVFNMTLSEIGKTIDRNHATILHALRQFEVWMQYDDLFKKKFLEFFSGRRYKIQRKNFDKEELEYQLDKAISKILMLENKIKKLRSEKKISE